MRILFACSEIIPLIKTGGLADVSNSLPSALKSMGHDVRVILPLYRSIKSNLMYQERICSLNVFGYLEPVTVYRTRLYGDGELDVYLVDAPALFDRDGGPYGDPNNKDWQDNAYRFTIFSRVAAMMGLDELGLEWRADIVHCNDWQTGLIPPLLKLKPSPPASVFTIHNLAYQGNFSKEEFDYLHLPQSWWSMSGLEFHGECSFLKSGLYYADRITTVSPTYAQEILTPALGEGMDGILRHRQASFDGILNGVDYQQWNPLTDEYIDHHYHAEDMLGKAENKLALQRRLGLEEMADKPLFGMVCRMAYQKGIDLVIDNLARFADQEAQFAILGSGDIYYEKAIEEMVEAFPGTIALHVGYDESLAHQIEAGADFFLMPSRYEPCGLNQMYSLKYGTLPLVRRTGGLADTVVDTNPETIADRSATGFVFDSAESVELGEAIERATEIYRNTDLMAQLRTQAMAQDYAWERSCRQYEKCYQLAMSHR